MGAGHAKTPGGRPGENGSQRGSAGCCGAKCTWRAFAAPGGGNPGSGLRRAGRPDPGLRRRRCRVGEGLESEGRHLVLLVADVQREVVQGAANDSIGANYSSWSPVTWPSRLTSTFSARVRSWAAAAAVLCLVEVCSAALSVFLKKNC
jgi:hypothetical protein